MGVNVNIGYYDQEHHLLGEDNTLFEEISNANPALTNTQIRTLLASFLFTDDDVFKRIKDISGGEKGRLSLAKLMLSKSNFLILDEPTNHLDITSKEILESALNQYSGTVLFVSHDRYFINKTATRILDLTKKTLVNYIGNYDYYLEKREILTPVSVSETAAPADKPSTQKLDWKQQKESQAQARKRENDLKKTETRIEELEQKCASLDEEMTKPENAINSAKLQKLSKEKETLSLELETLYEKWEELSE